MPAATGPATAAAARGGAVEIVAHRGAGAAFTQPEAPPENTLRAVEAGFAAGADGCEIDVHLTRDGHVAVIHDPTTGRTCDRDVAVSETDMAALRALDAGGWKGAAWAGEPIPALPEVLAAVPAGRTLWIELKSGPRAGADSGAGAGARARDPARIAEAVARDVRSSDTDAARVRAISFDLGVCAAIKRALPAAPCYLLVAFRWDPGALAWRAGYHDTGGGAYREVRAAIRRPGDLDRLVADARAAGADGLDVSWRHPEPLARACADAGAALAAWTVNRAAVALALAQRGARAITTDQPALVAHTLGRNGLR